MVKNASFDTGQTKDNIVRETDKSYLIVTARPSDGELVQYNVPKRLSMWKLADGAEQETLFLQSWFAKKIGVS